MWICSNKKRRFTNCIKCLPYVVLCISMMLPKIICFFCLFVCFKSNNVQWSDLKWQEKKKNSWCIIQSYDTNVKAANVKYNVSFQHCFLRSWICDYIETINSSSQQNSAYVRMMFVSARPAWDQTGPSTFAICVWLKRLFTHT